MTIPNRTLRDVVTDALVFRLSNSRTGMPEDREPACRAITAIAMNAIRYELIKIVCDEEPSDDHAGVQRVIELLEQR